MLENTYYFVDIEATGVDLKNDRIIQLAFLKVQAEKIEAYNDLCYTDIDMNDAVVEVHHITNAMLEDKPWPEEADSFVVLEKGNSESNFFISHGNTLDLQMLSNDDLEIVMQCIDTDKCARSLLKETHSFKLQDLIIKYELSKRALSVANKLGIKEINAHDALSDAIWHYVLFELLLEKVEGNIDTLVSLTSEPMLLEKITFGKHKNKSFEEIFTKEPLTLVWMYNTVAIDWPDLEFTLEYWLKSKEYFWKKATKEREDNKALFI